MKTIAKRQTRYVPDGDEKFIVTDNIAEKYVALGHFVTRVFYSDGTTEDRTATAQEAAVYKRTFGMLDMGAALE